MSESLFEEFDNDFAAAREQLKLALENPVYQEYASKQGPLYKGDVVNESPELLDVLERFGWPDEIDGVIKTPYLYPDSAKFLIDLAGSTRLDLGGNPVMNTLGAPVLDDIDDFTRGIDMMGKMPFVHRAHAIAPDLFDGLRVTINTMAARYRHFRRLDLGGVAASSSLEDSAPYATEDPVLAAYLQPEHSDLCEAIYMGYRIMSRLIKVDDPSRVNSASRSTISNAHDGLAGWWDR